jgi:hypothetical protein
MNNYVGQIFTEEMRQRIRMETTDLMNTSFDEGQCAMAPACCANKGTDKCKFTEHDDVFGDYDTTICRQCNLEGGFDI